MANKNNPDWLKLDNAAKFFPSSSNKRDTKVFRFACELNEEIDKDVLQKATLINLEKFPIYKSVLKKGVFWYYLETSDIVPIVEKEKLPVCSSIYEKDNINLLFKVCYYHKRINLEVYHSLSDGAGALEFLRGLVSEYLLLKYPEKFKKVKIDLNYHASMQDKIDDSFTKYYDNKGSKKKVKVRKAHIIKGLKYSERRLEVIEGIMSTSEMLALSKKYNTTVTVLVAAIFMKAINDDMSIRAKKKPVVLTIPVNLRQFFKSTTTRNFFGVFNVGYDFKNYSDDLEIIIAYLSNFFKEKLGYEAMGAVINSYVALEENILVRGVPLFIKNIALWIANKYIDTTITASLSNLGRITMPKEFDDYINLFDVFVSTNKVQICMNSYNEKMVISFTSAFINTNIQKNFFDTLNSLGINITVTSNIDMEDE